MRYPTLRRLAAVLMTLLAALLLLPTTAQAKKPPSLRTADFTLNAKVLDGGEQVTSVTLDTGHLGRLSKRISTDTFSVHVKATSPVPVTAGDLIFSEYDQDRVVTGVRIDKRGDVVIDLKHGEGVAGASTLAYLMPGADPIMGRNVLLDLDYTITQNKPLMLENGRQVRFERFRQGELVDPEVDAFSSHVSASGLNYRLFEPEKRTSEQGKRPLIVWLHGNGEGGLGDYYNNESPLRANRGALGPATREAQRAFGGAYVVSPQVPTSWVFTDKSWAPAVKSLIDDLVADHRIDTKRIYVMGASAGGYMTTNMVVSYPSMFAAAVPICPALTLGPNPSDYKFTEAQIKSMAGTPTWFIHSKDDPTVLYQPTSVWAHNLLPDTSLITLYDDVTWNGHRFDGHWSWIYAARNDPATADGTHLWQWMAMQKRAKAVSFTLNAEVLDGGEQVTSVTLHTSKLRLDPDAITADTFTVHAKATSPIPVPEGGSIFSEYDQDRAVTDVRVTRRGDVVLTLEHGEGVAGAATLGYLVTPTGSRNVLLDLDYTITQNEPLWTRNGRQVSLDRFRQGELRDPEVDAFRAGESADGLKYRLFLPERGKGDRPLIVWLHGGGEGGLGDYYNNESPLRANRGALGPATDEAQRIFGGAYVVSPQAASSWAADGSPQLVNALIEELIDQYRIDTSRIYVMGPSAGGFGTVNQVVNYPNTFAASVPICPPMARFTDEQIMLMRSTPTWFIHSKDDPVIPYGPTERAAGMLPGSELTLYDNVTWNGYVFNGHWSWIYAARNDPATADGMHLWQWMAKQRRAAAVTFTLNAEVLDGGEQVTSVTLDTSGIGGIDASSLKPGSFTVHAKATSPAPIQPGGAMYTEYDQDRDVTGVRVSRSGDVVLELASGEGVAGAATLGYLVPEGRNLLLDLTYTITQNEPLRTHSGRSVWLNTLKQGALEDPEVDKFQYKTSDEGMKYRLFVPKGGQYQRTQAGHALIVWLHGNGEGAIPGLYQNEAQLRANRGALGPASAQAQRIFGGAYVVAPQVPDTWYNTDANGYAEQVKAIIDDLSATYKIDESRIYVMGASAGGFMSVKLVAAYPHSFAAVVPTTPALFLNRTGEYTVTDDVVKQLQWTPTWFVHSKDDPTIPYDKASLWAHGLLPGSTLTSYEHVVWNGYTFNGHWSWIYTARNDPTNERGQHVWQWMAKQRLSA